MRAGRWTLSGRGQGEFPVPMANAAGNNLPGITGAIDPPYRPGPGPYSGGQLGGIGTPDDGVDPRADKIQPGPASPAWGAWGQGQAGTSQQTQSFRRYGTLGFNDKLTVKDRHAYWDAGQQRTGTDQPGSGGIGNSYNDPKIQPPRPDLRLVNRTLSTSWAPTRPGTRTT